MSRVNPSRIKVEKDDEEMKEFNFGYQGDICNGTIDEKLMIVKKEFVMPSLPYVDLSHVKIETTDGICHYRQEYLQQLGLEILGESIIVKEEHTVEAYKKEVQYSAERFDDHSEHSSPLAQLDNQERAVPSTSVHFTDYKNGTPNSKNAQGRTKHINSITAHKGHSCLYCTKSFKYKSLLKSHIRVHTGKKLFECNECRKHFSQKSYLQIHMRVHTGDRPYICSICPKVFAHNSNLKQHLRTHTADRPYTCRECLKAFKNHSNLKEHLRTHSGNRPYKCNECTKTFIQYSSQKQHLRTHTGDRPYSCSKCPKAFTNKSHLVQHLRVHTGDRPYKCSECPKAFTQTSHLTQHLRTHRE